MKIKTLAVIAGISCISLTVPAYANYDDYCGDTLGDVVGGAVEGGLIGTGIGAIADGGNGASRGAEIGAAVGAIDGLVEGEVKADRCKRDLRDLDDDIAEDDLDRAEIEDSLDDYDY